MTGCNDKSQCSQNNLDNHSGDSISVVVPSAMTLQKNLKVFFFMGTETRVNRDEGGFCGREKEIERERERERVHILGGG